MSSTKRDLGTRGFLWQTTHKLSSNAEVREGEQLYVQTTGRVESQNCCKTADEWCGEYARPCSVFEHLRDVGRKHLSKKLKEHGFIQDERDPCLFVNAELDICIGVHVDDMLAVGPSDATKKGVGKNLPRTWQCVEVW